MQTTFANRKAGFLWGFALAWWGMLLVMSWILLRDGPPPGYSLLATAAVAALFWLAGLGLASFVSRQACTRVTLHRRSHMEAVWRYPHRVVRRSVPFTQLAPARVVDDKDSDGDPYHFARVALADGGHVDLLESHHRPDCEAACRRFDQALFGT